MEASGSLPRNTAQDMTQGAGAQTNALVTASLRRLTRAGTGRGMPWSRSDLRLGQEIEKPRNTKPALMGRGSVRPEPGNVLFGDLTFPENPALRQAGNRHFRRRRSYGRVPASPFRRASQPEGESFACRSTIAAVAAQRARAPALRPSRL